MFRYSRIQKYVVYKGIAIKKLMAVCYMQTAYEVSYESKCKSVGGYAAGGK